MASKALNEMLTSPMALIGADRMAADAEKTGSARIHDATVHLARRLAKLMREAVEES